MEKKQNQVKIMNKEQNEDVDNEKHADKVRTREGPCRCAKPVEIKYFSIRLGFFQDFSQGGQNEI